MKILFLDIDGVLNDQTHLIRYNKQEKLEPIEGLDEHQHRMGLMINPRNVGILNSVIRLHSDMKIVLSSAWRGGWPPEDMGKMLYARGGDSELRTALISRTGHGFDGHRGKQIMSWLKNSPLDTEWNYAIVDDDSFDIMDTHDNRRFIHTSFVDLDGNGGLQREHIDLFNDAFSLGPVSQESLPVVVS